jgi:small-conductance mechanosensitive channel
MNCYFFDAAILAALSFAIYQITTIGRVIVSTQDQIDSLTAQVSKVQSEVVSAKEVLVAKLAEVQAQLDAAGAAEQVDLTGLQAAVQLLDDINPDPVPVVDVPVDVPPVDVPVDAPTE